MDSGQLCKSPLQLPADSGVLDRQSASYMLYRFYIKSATFIGCTNRSECQISTVTDGIMNSSKQFIEP